MGAAALGILAGAGLYLSAGVGCVIVLELNPSPLPQDRPSKARHDEATGGYDPRLRTTSYPATAPDEDRPRTED